MILVTGGTGFVGSHLLSKLVLKHDRIKAIYRDEKKLKLNNNILIKEELLEFHHNKSWSNIG